jgi:hypothetical protein
MAAEQCSKWTEIQSCSFLSHKHDILSYDYLQLCWHGTRIHAIAMGVQVLCVYLVLLQHAHSAIGGEGTDKGIHVKCLYYFLLCDTDRPFMLLTPFFPRAQVLDSMCFSVSWAPVGCVYKTREWLLLCLCDVISCLHQARHIICIQAYNTQL